MADQLRVPVEPPDVEAEGPRGVRGIGRVDASAGELPEEPAVHRAEGQLAAGRALPELGPGLEEPRDLGPREVGVQDQPGPGAHERLETVGAQALAERRRAAALPDDRPVDRDARPPVPEQGRLPLVGDPDRGQVARRDARRDERRPGGVELGRPDLGRIVLHPAGLGVVLRQLLVAAPEDRPVVADDQGGRPRRPLVEREDRPHGGAEIGRGRRQGRAPRSRSARSGWSVVT